MIQIHQVIDALTSVRGIVACVGIAMVVVAVTRVAIIVERYR